MPWFIVLIFIGAGIGGLALYRWVEMEERDYAESFNRQKERDEDG